MSFIHTGSIEVRTVNGRPQFTGTSEDHAVTGWPEPNAALRRRASSSYDTVVLTSRRGPAMVGRCLACGHISGCDCDCCPITLPAVAAALSTGGAR